MSASKLVTFEGLFLIQHDVYMLKRKGESVGMTENRHGGLENCGPTVKHRPIVKMNVCLA